MECIVYRWCCRLNAEIGQFCETIAMSMGLSSQDMNEFNTIYEKDKNNQHRILKAKFAVSKFTNWILSFFGNCDPHFLDLQHGAGCITCTAR